ncbi:MAG: transglutaminase-like cysteine peptidase [Desulfobulbaceae bacterium]|nr:transglutaminase-like cysteine peptidase [Desulfobulbaceae bacterium]
MSRNAFFLLLCMLTAFAVASCTRAPEIKAPSPPPKTDRPEPSVPEPDILELWQQLIAENRYSPEEKKLATVNSFFNGFDFVEDIYLWGMDDYWATLFETLARSAGDCEDITIAKYFTLRGLSVPADRMRLTYVFSAKTGNPHIVLTFHSDDLQEPLILDTVNNHLFPISQRNDLLPVYSFNEYGYWIARSEAGWKGKWLGSADGLSSWGDLLKRMQMNLYVYSE